MTPAGYLAGLQVLELGDGVAGSAATAVLASFGAAVTKVADPAALHRQSRPRTPGRDRALAAAVLDREKTVLGPEQVPALPSPAYDVVVVDRVGGAAAGAGPEALDDYSAWVAEANGGTWVTISAFGLDGPDCQRRGSELVVAAAAGSFVNQAGPHRRLPGERPLKLAGWQALRNAGQAAALAALHGLDLARRRRAPVHMDVSAQEAGIAVGPVLAVAHQLLGCTGITPGGRRYGAPAGWYPCSDGLLRISAMEEHQWRGLVQAMGSPAWAEGFSTMRQRIEGGDEVDDRVSAWTARGTRLEIEAALQAAGVPATGVYSPAEILASPQLAHRGTLATTSLGAEGPAPPVQVIERPFVVRSATTGGTAGGPGLAGLRVLEIGHVLAVPLAGALLGALGATVTKVEDLDRLDMYRRRAPWIGDEPGIDRAAYFAIVNHSKASVAAHFLAEPEALAAAVAGAQVVIENNGAGRAARLGVDAPTLAAARPDLLALSSTGFGLTGPLAAYRAYAYNLQSCCGLGYLSRDEDGVEAKIDIPWADLVSGYAIATVVAAWAVGPGGGGGAAIDFAMADCITARFDEFLAAASCSGDYEADLDWANDQLPLAPNGMYRTADGWLALSVENDRHWRALVEALGWPADLGEEVWATAPGRWSARRVLDGRLGKLTTQVAGAELAARLQAAGVPASTVRSPADLIADPHLEARGFFTPVQHPVWGRQRLIGMPWREAGAGPLPLRPPPLLATAEPVEVDAVSGRSAGRSG